MTGRATGEPSSHEKGGDERRGLISIDAAGDPGAGTPEIVSCGHYRGIVRRW
jgi:hypothetical protein